MISVIITCFNDGEILKKTLAGFVSQTFSPEKYEILLIDNNSTEILQSVYALFYDKLPVYMLQQPKLESTFSLCRARNTGLRLAKYDIIASLDSDCIPNKNYLNEVSKYSQEMMYNLITGERVFVDLNEYGYNELLHNSNILDTVTPIRSAANYYKLKDRRFPDILTLDNCKQPWGLIHGGNMVFSKQTALKIGGFDERYDGCWGYEDIDFAYRMIKTGNCQPRFLDSIYCYHQEKVNESCDYSQRMDKTKNRNWALISKTIPGFKEFKEEQYTRINKDIKL